LKVRAIEKEEVWHPKVQELIINNIFTLNPEAPLPAAFKNTSKVIELSLLALSICVIIVGVSNAFSIWAKKS